MKSEERLSARVIQDINFMAANGNTEGLRDLFDTMDHPTQLKALKTPLVSSAGIGVAQEQYPVQAAAAHPETLQFLLGRALQLGKPKDGAHADDCFKPSLRQRIFGSNTQRSNTALYEAVELVGMALRDKQQHQEGVQDTETGIQTNPHDQLVADRLHAVEVLLAYNANTETRGVYNGKTPFHVAVENAALSAEQTKATPDEAHFTLLQMLKEAGADVNAQVEPSGASKLDKGKTALHLAVSKENNAVLTDFLVREMGVDTTIRDSQKHTARDLTTDAAVRDALLGHMNEGKEAKPIVTTIHGRVVPARALTASERAAHEEVKAAIAEIDLPVEKVKLTPAEQAELERLEQLAELERGLETRMRQMASTPDSTTKTTRVGRSR